MNNLLSGKKILIAGGGGLLGTKIIKHALLQGAQVIATDINTDLMQEKLINENVDILSGNISLIKLDINNEKEVKTFFSSQEGITGAVNSAYPRNKKYGAHFFDVSLESFNENVALHLGSAFLFTQQCALYFKEESRPFSLVNVSSIYGVVAPKFDIYDNTSMTMPIEYAAIKSAILHMNKYVVSYVNDTQFRINSVSPGGIFDHQPESFLRSYKEKTHGTGMLDVESIVGSILYLLSDQSKYVTGQNIIVDDGFCL